MMRTRTLLRRSLYSKKYQIRGDGNDHNNDDGFHGGRCMSTGKRLKNRWCIPLALAILIVFMVGSAGCVNMIKKSTEGGNTVTPAGTPIVTENPVTPALTPQIHPPTVQQTVAQITP